ncbi:MAG: glycosyltransferase family 39 protein [Verrucomicrobia bacterium]|nr:glycosyltransferase family 39 protein [Verrucomicrobiota bacterium]
MAPSPAISASPITWPPEIQGTSKPGFYQTSLFRLLLVWASLLGVFYIGSCGYPRLLDQIDGQYAGAAREMISRNDWVVPTQNSIPRLRKPPLAYWMEILSLRSFGENEFAARLPICLATFAWFIATAGLAYECTRDKLTSLASSLILATFFGTFQFCHLIMPEPAFGFLTTFTFWLLVRLARKIPDRREGGNADHDVLKNLSGDRLKPPITTHHLSSEASAKGESPLITLELTLLWVAMAVAVLCKGAHGILLPLGVLLVAAVFRPSLRVVCRRIIFNPTGWLIFIALVLPWYLAVEHRYPGFILDQLGNEQVNQVLGRRWPVDGDHLGLLNFWLEQFAILFPWTLLIPGAAVTSFRIVHTKISQNALLLLLWFGIYSVAITFANLQDYYLLICFPVIAIWLAWSLGQGIPRLFSAWFPGILLILLGAGGIILSGQPLAPLLSSEGTGRGEQPAINSVASALVNVAGAAGRTLSNILLLFGIGAIAFALLIILFRRQKLAPVIFLPPFVLLICFLGLTGEVALQDYLSSASIASVIERNSDANTLIISQGDISDRTSLFFYLHRQLHWLDGIPAQEYAARKYGIGADLYLKKADVVAAWHTARKVCIIVGNHSLTSLAEDLRVDPNLVHVLATTPTDVVIANWE